jgi:hypothetical protein
MSEGVCCVTTMSGQHVCVDSGYFPKEEMKM